MNYLKIIAALWALTFLLAIVGCFQPLQQAVAPAEVLQLRTEKLAPAAMFGLL